MKVLVIVLLVLTVLLLTPIGVDGGYSGERLVLGIRVGFFNIRIFPKAKKHSEQKPPRKNRKPKKEKDKKPKFKLPTEKKKLIELIKIVLRTLGRFKRKLRIDYLRIRYTFASDDPFSTAMGFGYSSAALGAVIPLVDKAFSIGKRDIGASFDFLSDKPVFDCWLTMTIQIWEVLYIAIAFGIDYLKLRHRQKREDRI